MWGVFKKSLAILISHTRESIPINLHEATFVGEVVGIGAGGALGDFFAEGGEEVGPELGECSVGGEEVHRAGLEDVVSGGVEVGFVD